MSEQRSFQQQSQESFQSSNSFQQTSSVRQQEVYEATERDGAMRGYQPKGVDETGRRSAMARDSGLFGGIGGDDNSLVDNEFDYKKHSVKDLAQHFALVKPKAQLPNQILPEQKMFNGEQGPALNYLGGKQDFASQQQTFTKKEVSNEDIEASKKAYEMKKKQQMEQRQQQQSSSSSSSMSSSQTSNSVVMREKKTEEVKAEQNERRRASISSALLMDPAAAHAEAGLIDPSAILRGEQLTRWALPPAKTPDAPSAPTHSSTLYRPKQSAGFRPFSGSASGPSCPPTPFSQPPATQSQPQPPPPQCPVIVETFEGSPPPKRQATSPAGPSAPSVMCPSSPPQYQATVKTSATVHPITNTDTALQTTNNNQHTLTNHSLGERHLADTVLSLVPELPRSTESSPGGRPSVETTSTSSLAPPRNVAPSPTPSRRTPILVTTRPSSVSLDQRTRHVSKDDLARMMAELNAPLPPMVEIPDEIRASPLIFHGGLAAVSQQHPHHLNTQTITNGQTSQSSSNSTSHLHQ